MSGSSQSTSLRKLLGADAMTANGMAIQTPRAFSKSRSGAEELDDDALEAKAKQKKMILIVVITAAAAIAINSL